MDNNKWENCVSGKQLIRVKELDYEYFLIKKKKVTVSLKDSIQIGLTINCYKQFF